MSLFRLVCEQYFQAASLSRPYYVERLPVRRQRKSVCDQ